MCKCMYALARAYHMYYVATYYAKIYNKGQEGFADWQQNFNQQNYTTRVDLKFLFFNEVKGNRKQLEINGRWRGQI